MSAAEIIEQIKFLPPEERDRVVEFVQTLGSQPFTVRHMDEDTFKAASDKVFEKYDDLLRRLAQ